MWYNLETEDIQCLLNLKYKAVTCNTCQGKGVGYVDENGDVHPSRIGFEGKWYYDSMEQVCEECDGLKVKVLLDTGTHL